MTFNCHNHKVKMHISCGERKFSLSPVYSHVCTCVTLTGTQTYARKERISYITYEYKYKIN